MKLARLHSHFFIWLHCWNYSKSIAKSMYCLQSTRNFNAIYNLYCQCSISTHRGWKTMVGFVSFRFHLFFRFIFYFFYFVFFLDCAGILRNCAKHGSLQTFTKYTHTKKKHYKKSIRNATINTHIHKKDTGTMVSKCRFAKICSKIYSNVIWSCIVTNL